MNGSKIETLLFNASSEHVYINRVLFFENFDRFFFLYNNNNLNMIVLSVKHIHGYSILNIIIYED